MADRSWDHAVLESPVFDVNILHINADVLPDALEDLPPDLRRGRRNVGYWTWELPEFPARWHGSFDLVDEVWVPSTFVQAAIGADAPVPVRVLPHVVRARAGRFLDRAALGLPADTCQFLVMYDTQSVQQRKNPQGAVEAYRRAFPTAEAGASLVLKVNSAGDREVDELRRSTAGRSDIHLITDVLARHEVDSLVAASDAFVSLHRSEGFGLVIAEAMALGVPVIATGWSGNMDYMTAENAVVVDYRLVELERSYGPYDAGSHWAEPDLDQAASWMQRLRDDPALGRSLGEQARSDILASHSPEAVGRLMARYLAEVRAA
jgi:glycosyltransferase involved in cell wall biosynthesis